MSLPEYTDPPLKNQFSGEDHTWRIDCSALLGDGQTVTSPTAALTSLGDDTATPVSLADTPGIVGGFIVTQRIRSGVLTARTSYQLLVNVGVSGTTDTFDEILNINCPG